MMARLVLLKAVDMNGNQKIKVWDAFIRFFHWSLLLSVSLAYFTAKSGMQVIHPVIGYFITVILVMRIVWGFAGSAHARFSSFVRSPKVVIGYLKDMLKGHPARHLGHNPAGGVMVVALLLTLLGIILSGFVVLAVIEFDGPLVGLLRFMSDQWAYLFLAIHNRLVMLIIVLVVFHISGVVLASIQHNENLIKAMITGYKNNNNAK